MTLREDIKIKKNCRFGENCIIYLTPFTPYLKSEKQKNEILVCLRPHLPPPVRVKNLVIFKVYCNTFVVTFQCSETSLTSSESKQDETKLVKANIQCR